MTPTHDTKGGCQVRPSECYVTPGGCQGTPTTHVTLSQDLPYWIWWAGQRTEGKYLPESHDIIRTENKQFEKFPGVFICFYNSISPLQLGEPFDETTPDGREVTAVCSLEGGKIVSVQKAKKEGQKSTRV